MKYRFVLSKDGFMWAFLLYYISTFLLYTNITKFNSGEICLKSIRYISYILFIFISISKIVKIKIKASSIFMIISIFISLIIQLSYHRDITILVLLFVGFSSIDANQKKCLKNIYQVTLLMITIVILLSAFGVIENTYKGLFKYGFFVNRYSLGFNYSGQLQMALFTFTLLYLYVHYQKFTLKKIILIFLLNTVVFIITKTITPYIFSIISLFFFGKLESINNILYRKKGILKIFPFLIVIIILYISYLYYTGSNIGKIINELFSNRPKMNVQAISEYGITLIGTNFHNIIEYGKYLVLDSEYISALVAHGIIYLIILLGIISKIINYSIKVKNTALLIIYIIFSVYLMINNGILDIAMNPFLIFMGPAILDKVEDTKNHY